MSQLFACFAKDASGATAVEYSMIAALVAGVIVGTVTALGLQVSAMFTTVVATF